MPRQDEARFIGCTIITGNQSGTPHVIRIDTSRLQDLEYEMIEGEDRVFITAAIPPGITSAVYTDIQAEKIAIIAGERRTEIDPPCRIDILESFYQVKNGIIDIVLKKERRKAVPR
ncbi:MAG TPA: heat-shock protein Hsp90 [Methanolinea sp.]|nr:heat-shock protein Hsp90 [Methanolinea sp.]